MMVRRRRFFMFVVVHLERGNQLFVEVKGDCTMHAFAVLQTNL